MRSLRRRARGACTCLIGASLAAAFQAPRSRLLPRQKTPAPGHMATGSWQPLKLPQLRRYSTASSGLDGLGDESSRKAWKEMEKAYGGSKEFKLRRGMARIPSIVNLSPTLPPASRMQKLKDLLLRRKPIYGALYHEDYTEACRSLGVPPDIDESDLYSKVQQLHEKYEKDRKKKIMIDWAYDKITEHRLFLQLHGEAKKPSGFDPRALDERNYELTEQDALDLITTLDLNPASLQAQPGPLNWLLNNPMTRLLRFDRVFGQMGYVWKAMQESYQGPNPRFLLWPGALALGLVFAVSGAVDSFTLKHVINTALQAGPVYNRGEPPSKRAREYKPVKWRKGYLALCFMAIVNAGGWALGRAYVALKYPTFDLSPPQFIVILCNFLTYFAASSFFIRESTLAAGGGGRSGRR